VPSVSLNWHDLRPWQGSQHHAFEELCAQLAAAEPPQPGAIFVRKAPPDAGIECYWQLATGEEWGWQAKFFSSIGDAQWRDLDGSVATALEKHPRLAKYVICTPLDFSDPRLPEKAYPMDRWQARVAKWQGWADARGMRVTFPYWLGAARAREPTPARSASWTGSLLVWEATL